MQTFRTVREEDCYYVDKTPYIARLLDEGRYYFLSRPRRFGKSLFLNTLKELFEGNEELFTVLHIHDPILDALESPETARANRDYLRGLYGVIKASDAHVRFTFVTGVSKFSKVSLFPTRTTSPTSRYTSVAYSYFAALGYEIVVEESSSHGRLDLAVRTGGHVYLFEFKVVEMAPPGSALAQLRERGYAEKYRGGGEPIHLIGVEFSRETRNVTAFEVADG